MKRLVEFPLQDGGVVVVEIDKPETKGGPVRGLGGGEVMDRAKQTFEAALEKIRPVAGAIITQLRDLSEPPDKVKVEFGVKMSAEAGAVIASAGVEGNYKVTLTWTNKKGAAK